MADNKAIPDLSLPAEKTALTAVAKERKPKASPRKRDKPDDESPRDAAAARIHSPTSSYTNNVLLLQSVMRAMLARQDSGKLSAFPFWPTLKKKKLFWSSAPSNNI
jgi:hypothetical protein